MLALWPVLKCFEQAGDEVRLACLSNGMVEIQPLKRDILAAISLIVLALEWTLGLSGLPHREVKALEEVVGNKRGSPRAFLLSVVAAPVFHPHPSPPSLSCSLASPSLFQAKLLHKFSLLSSVFMPASLILNKWFMQSRESMLSSCRQVVLIRG